MNMHIKSKAVNYLVELDKPVILEEKTVRMGETVVHHRYEAVDVRVMFGTETGGVSTMVRGYELNIKSGKRKKRAPDARPEYIPTTCTITIHEDGRTTSNYSEYEAIERAAKDVVAEQERRGAGL